jgi:hypothetical protein
MTDRYVLKDPTGKYVNVDLTGRRFALVSSQKVATRFDQVHARRFANTHKGERFVLVRLKSGDRATV